MPTCKRCLLWSIPNNQHLLLVVVYHEFKNRVVLVLRPDINAGLFHGRTWNMMSSKDIWSSSRLSLEPRALIQSITFAWVIGPLVIGLTPTPTLLWWWVPPQLWIGLVWSHIMITVLCETQASYWGGVPRPASIRLNKQNQQHSSFFEPGSLNTTTDTHRSLRDRWSNELIYTLHTPFEFICLCDSTGGWTQPRYIFTTSSSTNVQQAQRSQGILKAGIFSIHIQCRQFQVQSAQRANTSKVVYFRSFQFIQQASFSVQSSR